MKAPKRIVAFFILPALATFLSIYAYLYFREPVWPMSTPYIPGEDAALNDLTKRFVGFHERFLIAEFVGKEFNGVPYVAEAGMIRSKTDRTPYIIWRTNKLGLITDMWILIKD